MRWFWRWRESPRSFAPSPSFLERLEGRLLLSSTGEGPTLLRTFAGLKESDNTERYPVPDVIAAAGPSHVVEAVNAVVRVFDKSTGAVLSTQQIAQFFAPLGNVQNFTDPVVSYDENA